MTTETVATRVDPEDTQPLCPFCLTVSHSNACDYDTMRTAIAVRDGELARMRRLIGDVNGLNEWFNVKKAKRTQSAIRRRIQQYFKNG